MLLRLWTKLVRDDRAASMVEYALLIVLIAIIAFVAVQLAGREVSETFSKMANSLETSSS